MTYNVAGFKNENIKQLIEMLKEKYTISTYRTTIAKDIAALQEFGVDVIVIPAMKPLGGSDIKKG
jgi:hypothetical protein